MADKRFFDPEKVAQLETAAWRARLEGRSLREVRLLAQLAREQFQMGWPDALRAGRDAAAAAAAWRHGDPNAAWNHLHGYYRLAQRASGLLFDPAVVSKLEVDALVAHQRVAGSEDKTDWFNALIDLQMALYRVPEVVARGAAQWRSRAIGTLDQIAAGQSADPDEDWRKIESDLQRCYKGIHALLTSV